MGWYVTCKVCGASAKRQHPDCGHKEQQEEEIRRKMCGATIREVSFNYPHQGLCLRLEQDGEEFWVDYTAPEDYVEGGLEMRPVDTDGADEVAEAAEFAEADKDTENAERNVTFHNE
jgi:hypothetical protein